MADLPEATVAIDDTAGAFAGATGFAVVMAAVATNADTTPRVFSSVKNLLDEHDYSPGADYVALHIEATRKPVIFIGLPIAVPGVVKRTFSDVAGSCVISATADANGAMDEADVIAIVTKGGTIGTSQIVFSLSLDGGVSFKTVRLGTASSYDIPYLGVTLHFAAGDLDVGDMFTFSTTAPMWDSAGLTAARVALARQQKLARSWIVIGDLPDSTHADNVTTEANAYETTNKRFTYARAQVRDRKPYAKTSGVSLTFAATDHTITRASGSWFDDGYRNGDVMAVTGASQSGNNGNHTLTGLTATVATFASGLADETTAGATVTTGETVAAYTSAMDSGFAEVDSQKRIDLGIGRLRKASPIHGWNLRRPVQWAASIREYQHDLHIPCWRKSDGPLDNWKIADADNNVVEFDEANDGGALAARFTCARTWENGPEGAFIALSLTRAPEASLLSRTHNMAVTNLACTVTQAESENAVGQSLVLKNDGTATTDSIAKIEQRVNSALQRNLLSDLQKEGPRASLAFWQASRNDVLNVPGAELTGTLFLLLNGTLEKIRTSVRVQTNG